MVDEVLTSEEYISYRMRTHDVIKMAPAPDIRRWFLPPRPGGGGPPLPIGASIPGLVGSVLAAAGVGRRGRGEMVAAAAAEEEEQEEDEVKAALVGRALSSLSSFLGGVAGAAGGGGMQPPGGL